MNPKAVIMLEEGPLDGLELNWPKRGGDFPEQINFGFYEELEGHEDALRVSRILKLHEYNAFYSENSQEIGDDGLPVKEWQFYKYSKTQTEKQRSIENLWNMKIDFLFELLNKHCFWRVCKEGSGRMSVCLKRDDGYETTYSRKNESLINLLRRVLEK